MCNAISVEGGRYTDARTRTCGPGLDDQSKNSAPRSTAAESGPGYAGRVETPALVAMEAFKPVVLCRRPPNNRMNRTARERCSRVPVALRAPAAGYAER